MEHRVDSPTKEYSISTQTVGLGLPVGIHKSALRAGFVQLMAASSVADVKNVRDKAEAVRRYAQSAKLGLEVQNEAAELRIRAERKAGKLLASMRLRGGNRNSKSQRATLNKIGITKHQSSRWQQLASIPEQEFHAWVDDCRKSRKELTSASLFRIACQSKSKAAESLRETHEAPVFQDIRELLNHTETLEGIILPAVNSVQNLELKRVERQVIYRLIRELKQLIGSVEKSVSKMAKGLGD